MTTTFFTDFEGKEHAIIEHEDGSTTSMFKIIYDEMIAKQSEVTND
jgi:hypothetical protein